MLINNSRAEANVHVLCRGMRSHTAPEVLRARKFSLGGSIPAADLRANDVYAAGKTIESMVLLQAPKAGQSVSAAVKGYQVHSNPPLFIQDAQPERAGYDCLWLGSPFH